MDFYAVKTAPQTTLGQCSRPECAAPALAHCGLVISTVAGPLKSFFCLQDYLQALSVMQALEARGEGNQQAWKAVTRLGAEILPAATRLLGGSLPPKGELWSASAAADHEHEQARARYQDADDATEEGRELRLEVLRSGAICLLYAFCIEARAAQDKTGDRAVEGTLFHVSQDFLTEDCRIIASKSVPHTHVMIALLALCAVRSISPQNEAGERAAITKTLGAVLDLTRGREAGAGEIPSPAGQELARVLAALPVTQTRGEHAGVSPWASAIPSGGAAWRARAREGSLLGAGLARLRQGQAPTPTQARPVGFYLQAFEERIESLRRRARDHEIDAGIWQGRYERIADEWNGVCKALAEFGVELFYRREWEWEWRGDDAVGGPGAGYGYNDVAQALLAALRWRIERG